MNWSPKPAFAVVVTDDLTLITYFTYSFDRTTIPAALTRCGKRRKIMRCDIWGGGLRFPILKHLGMGSAFCRPPDKFDPKEGAERSFRRAIEIVVKLLAKNTSECQQIKRAAWNAFLKSKAWRRIQCKKKQGMVFPEVVRPGSDEGKNESDNRQGS